MGFDQAARRHLRAANTLYENASPGAQPGNQAVAGYLFGLAGELAVKQMMRAGGMRPQGPEKRRDDPFFAHFPELKGRLLDAAWGRNAGKLRQLAEDARLFQHWDTDMRYAPTGQINSERVAAWKLSAERLIADMDSQ